MTPSRFFIFAVLFTLLTGCAGQAVVPGPALPSSGGAEGVLTDAEGRPVSGAEVYFYTDPSKKFRGPADFMAEPTGADGKYVTELPAGKYFAVARRRASGSISGNLQKGDYYTPEAYGPIDVADSGYVHVDLRLEELTGNMLFSVFSGRGGGQGIKGVIKARDGKPYARAYAFAYKDPKMAGKPDYVSEWTREDGVYVVYVLEPGKYYVGARTGFMGVPKPDEPYGRYEGSGDHSVKVEEGALVEGIDITLKRFSGSR
jgi:hypothetical protein